MTVTHTITITKVAERSLNFDKTAKVVVDIAHSLETPARRARGWTITPRADAIIAGREVLLRQSTDPTTGGILYTATLAVVNNKEDERPTIAAEWQSIIAACNVKCQRPRFTLAMLDGEKYVPSTRSDEEKRTDDVGYAPFHVPDDWGTNFQHLYGLDANINRVRRALEAAVLSSWRHRFHVALIGPPGCGKSDLCQSLKKALGEDSVMEFDATATTMAGAQKELTEREELPRVLVVEEIEKANDAALAWLLSVLDLRAEVRKTTARGSLLRDTRLLVIATVNDFPTFEKVAFGALASRFANQVFFQRPSRDLLGRILQREIALINGNMKWVAPALDYAEEIDTTDPREVIAIALCGRDDLLTGEYQKEMRATRSLVALTHSGADVQVA